MSDLISRQQPVARDTNVLSNDTVSRQAAIDTLADMHCKSDEEGYVWIIRSDAWARIDALPSAQPDIIACGDCKHWICHDRRCGYWNHGVKPLEWCCHAERRTDSDGRD